jgi:hypothetical protein
MLLHELGHVDMYVNRFNKDFKAYVENATNKEQCANDFSTKYFYQVKNYLLKNHLELYKKIRILEN